jgi:uncharacterized membrane protein
MTRKRGNKGSSRREPIQPSIQRSSGSTPPADPQQQLEYRRMMYALEYSSGPLPPPSTLERYAQIIPGGAERIVGWVETQAAHRQSLEAKRLDADIKNESRGQLFAFIITVLSICGGTFLIYSGRDASGLTLMISELAILAGVFIYNNVVQKKELQEKMRELLEGERDGEEPEV